MLFRSAISCYWQCPSGMGVFRALTSNISPDIYQPEGGNTIYVFELEDMARARVRGETRRGAPRDAAGGRETRNRAFERRDARGRAVCDYVVLHYRYYLWCARCVR